MQVEDKDFIRLAIRSPRETLGDFPILPRLIDKIRLHLSGQLPPVYVGNLLMPPPYLDGRFLSFVEISPEEMSEIVASGIGDEQILAWVRSRGVPRSPEEIEKWRFSIENSPVPEDRVAHRVSAYPEVAARFDVSNMSPFDLLDLDEGRILTPSSRRT
ncbi:DUF5069 domain-containing protein [Leptospirillum ferriphilum]|jgi:hypothetical protein|uniref:DUF5069 domain-containing protein n=1 Tax=Leptospirillum ferriphilum (strain ML-04) TaxID=1048260 RepID=J9ZBE0_LEPFM|nr:DUF5069 domain-containing protein [Leptospirillum ferriphilum]AFS53749.1 hypothetical protein LFML04_1539 [Leptospirillum ferriphilum ML-04]